MNLLSDVNSFVISPEFDVTSLDGGKQCPPFKSRLFHLADRVIAHEALDKEQQALMEHIEKCHMCRSIYSGAIYFSQPGFEVPTPNLADEIMNGMANTRLDRLLGATENFPYVDGPFSVYVGKLCKQAEVDNRGALRVLGVCWEGQSGLTLLDECTKESVEAGLRLRMKRDTIALALWNSRVSTAVAGQGPEADPEPQEDGSLVGSTAVEGQGTEADPVPQEVRSLATYRNFVFNYV